MRSDADASGEIDPALTVSTFDYELPPELIAQTPLADRTSSRLLVVGRNAGVEAETAVRELGNFLAPGDLLIGNNSRVVAARLFGVRPDTGGKVEFLLLQREQAGDWTALAKPARRLRPGTRVSLTSHHGGEAAADLTVVSALGDGLVRVALPAEVEANLPSFGAMPLPPYITARLEDDERYQTVYSRELGSAAAPTAGLHFTPELMRSLAEIGIGWAEVTLHVGLDTFRPVAVERVADHVMHSEQWSAPGSTLAAIQTAKSRGNRVVAIGTTSARTLESIARVWDWRQDEPADLHGATSIFIVPGYEWQLVDAMLTNFHLPRSTLLMMVSSLAGRAVIEQAYAQAIAAKFRFFSFGDAMLIR